MFRTAVIMGTEVELHNLVDLALRTPDVGVVNFNHLRTLLHAILKHLALSGSLKGSHETTLTRSEQLENENKTTLAGPESSGLNELKTNDNPKEILPETSLSYWKSNEVDLLESENNEDSKRFRQHNLEKKVLELENKLKVLDELPTNKLIIEHAQKNAATSYNEAGSSQASLVGVWQFMKVNRRLQAAEEGIDRIMAIINEYFEKGSGSVKDVKNEVSGLADDVKNLKNILQGKELESLSSIQEKLKGLDNLVNREELIQFVKWPALEEALNVKKKSVAVEDVVAMIDDDQETFSSRSQSAPDKTDQVPTSPPEPPKTSVSQCTQVGSPEIHKETINSEHPSEEMLECLCQIGELTARHEAVAEEVCNLMKKQEKLKGEVVRLEGERQTVEQLNQQLMKSNEDQNILAELSRMARNNKDQIEGVRREMAVMARQSSKPTVIESTTPRSPELDIEALNTLKGHLFELQSVQEKLADDAKRRHDEFLDDLNRKQEHIDALYDYVEKLQENKANKENVAMEMDVMADKIALDSKMNLARFDDNFNSLGEGLREAMQKMDDYMNEEMALKQALAKLSADLKGKTDGHAFQALKDYLENRIADLQKSRNRIAEETKMTPAEAAGLRRRISLNCISCSRPVHVGIKDKSQPTLPQVQSIRMKKSKGPYLSYEMDQIRHFQRTSFAVPGPMRHDRLTVKDFVISGRPCGGSHTVMYNQLRRPAKLAQFNQIFASTGGEESAPQETWSREVSVIDMLRGSDGHVYKGRYKQTLPSIPVRNSSPSSYGSFSSDSPPPTTEGNGMTTTNLAELSKQQPQVEEKEAINTEREIVEEEPNETNGTPRSSQRASPRARVKQIVKKQRSRTQSPRLFSTPSPPTVSEGEYQQILQQKEVQRRKQESGQLKVFIPQISTDHKPTLGDIEINELENRSNADEEESCVGESPSPLQAQAKTDHGVPAVQPLAGQDRPFSIDSVDVP